MEILAYGLTTAASRCCEIDDNDNCVFLVTAVFPEKTGLLRAVLMCLEARQADGAPWARRHGWAP